MPSYIPTLEMRSDILTKSSYIPTLEMRSDILTKIMPGPTIVLLRSMIRINLTTYHEGKIRGGVLDKMVFSF
jgi:hypothetical protein